MLKVLILADQPRWVVNRVVDRIIKGTPCNFTKRFYTEITPEKLVEISPSFDLIHYSNFDLTYHLSILDRIKTPFLLGIRSSRYPNYFENLPEIISKNNFYVHVLNKGLLKEFPNAKYIPNGIFDQFKPKKNFVVGFSGIPSEDKGFQMIRQACEELGVKFFPATGKIPPQKMPNYYKKINLLVSASENEGHCNPIHECMAMNIPVITTNTNAVKDYNLIKIDRSVEGIKEGILKFYTSPQVQHLTWENICKQFLNYYYEILIKEKRKGNKRVRKTIKELKEENILLKNKFFPE